MAADDFPHGPLADIVLRAAVRVKQPEAGGGHQRKIARVSRAAKALGDSVVELFRVCRADKGIQPDYIPVPYKPDGLIGLHDCEHVHQPLSSVSVLHYHPSAAQMQALSIFFRPDRDVRRKLTIL